MGKEIDPAYGRKTFNCPHCKICTQQNWESSLYAKDNIAATRRTPTQQIYHPLHDFASSTCINCRRTSIWLASSGKIVFPKVRLGPDPNQDLSEECKTDFDEARGIANDSPRGAAALLRLCIQKFCEELLDKKDTLNNLIAELVKKGLHQKIQKSLDAVRVIGNEAVHPGTMDLNDDIGTVETLFDLVNIIAEKMISEEIKIDKIVQKIPENKKTHIEQRDK